MTARAGGLAVQSALELRAVARGAAAERRAVIRSMELTAEIDGMGDASARRQLPIFAVAARARGFPVDASLQAIAVTDGARGNGLAIAARVPHAAQTCLVRHRAGNAGGNVARTEGIARIQAPRHSKGDRGQCNNA